ncbi:MAG: PilZ domain-containing protein [Planctomycetota bacterium]
MSDRRQHPRFTTLALTTPYGQVTNLSDTGLCIFRKGKLSIAQGEKLTFVIRHDQAEVTIEGEVVRIDPLGLFRHEIGIAFTTVDAKELCGIRRLIEVAHAESISPTCFLAA